MIETTNNFKTSKLACPYCSENSFTVFRKDEISEEIYLHHCRCLECNQLFVLRERKCWHLEVINMNNDFFLPCIDEKIASKTNR